MSGKASPSVKSPGMVISEGLDSPNFEHDDEEIANTFRPQETFSIATPVVTNNSRINDSLNETSFLQSAGSYHPADTQFINLHHEQQLDHHKDDMHNPKAAQDQSQDDTSRDLNSFQSVDDIGRSKVQAGANSQVSIDDVAKSNITATSSKEPSNPSGADAINGLSPNKTHSSDNSTTSGKRKGVRKGAKLDTKSKLEKSRQSARECRARKKLRYQYLEDLVSNREKAVVKLREELAMFCDMSRRIDDGTISENDRHLLIEQTKENSS